MKAPPSLIIISRGEVMTGILNTIFHRLSEFLVLIFSALLLVIPACYAIDKNNHDEEPTPVSFEVLAARSMGSTGDEYPCQLNTSNLDMDNREDELSAIELTITSGEDFEKYIICNDEDMVVPNFDEYVILAGLTTFHPQCIYVKEQDVYLSQDTLIYEITIADMDCHVPDRAQYIAMISKDFLEYPVAFKVQPGYEKFCVYILL